MDWSLDKVRVYKELRLDELTLFEYSTTLLEGNYFRNDKERNTTTNILLNMVLKHAFPDTSRMPHCDRMVEMNFHVNVTWACHFTSQQFHNSTLVERRNGSHDPGYSGPF